MKRLCGLVAVAGLMVGSVDTADAGTDVPASRTETGEHHALDKLVASDGMPSDRFGISVAVSGDTALVGAPVDDAERGAAYVFTRVQGRWVEQAKLVAPDGRSLRKFGYAVALSGDIAVIGGSTAVAALLPTVHADPVPGSVYVFRRVKQQWVEQARLTAPASDAVRGDDFGSAVAVSGDTIVVGARGVGVGGAAYVFTRAGRTWRQQAKLSSDDVRSGGDFGAAVSVSGDTAVVGARNDDVGNNDVVQGSAYVFTRDGDRWPLEDELAASGGAGGDSFGSSVGVSGDTVVVGAVGDDVDGRENQGSAYVFGRDGGAWSQEQHLTADDGAARDEFGRSVAISGQTVVIGAQRDSTGDNLQHGSAYVFTRDGSEWQERLTLTASDSGRADLFGVSVALSDGTAVIGAGFHNLHTGAAYVWQDRERT